MSACHPSVDSQPPLSAYCSAVVGEVDEDADAELTLDEIMAEPLKPVIH